LHDPSQALPDAEKIRYAQNVTSGLNYLHSRHIVHRDLKSLNVLLDHRQPRRAKLSDFGLARLKAQTGSKMYLGEAKGSVLWMAPELFRLQAPYTQYSDVYSYAMTLWEIASRQIPYQATHDHQVIIAAVKSGEREQIPAGTPTVLRQIIEDCWIAEPKDRPVMSELLLKLQGIKRGVASPDVSISFAENLMSRGNL
jgi:serine/threonine protein kinase